MKKTLLTLAVIASIAVITITNSTVCAAIALLAGGISLYYLIDSLGWIPENL